MSGDSTTSPPVLVAGEASTRKAAGVLRAGGLVGFPTETVYGLAADARSAEAVEKVFRAKGRPPDHPLIVHLGPDSDLSEWAREVPDEAARLIEAFWPGPLTLVLKRHPSVPLEVTGGRDTVAVRMPSSPVALGILEAFGGGLAAPSANRFGRVSPTTAADVVAELGAAVDLVVDGGPCLIGVESTVVEFTSGPEANQGSSGVTVLRPGGVSVEEIEEALGGPVGTLPAGPARAPGMLPSHYAPTTPIRLCTPDEAPERVAELVRAGNRVGLLSPGILGASEAQASWEAGGDLGLLARSLYGWLREADSESLDYLVAVPPEPVGLGAAVRDRLVRAAHGSPSPESRT